MAYLRDLTHAFALRSIARMKWKGRIIKILWICFGIVVSNFALAYLYIAHASPRSHEPRHMIYRAGHDRAPDLWQVMRDQFILPNYSNYPAVAAQIRWYQLHRYYFERILKRSRPYMYYIYQQVKVHHLPVELALLPTIESAYNPFAYSHAGAAGLWQIMPVTANYFGIKHNYWFDGRRDITSSTTMALNYLDYLNDFFNHDWLLAVAAYDSGEGTVLNAVQENLRHGHNASFWYLPLPMETRAYVPRFLAIITIIRDPRYYGFNLPYIAATPYLKKIIISHPMRLSKVAELADISMEELYELNPGYNRWITGPRGSFRLLLPLTKVAHFRREYAYYEKHRTQHHEVKSGESLSTIAAHYHSSVSELKQFNHLKNSMIRIGQDIAIPPQLGPIKRAHSAPSHHHFYAKQYAPYRYTVKKNDSLWKLAIDNHTTIAKIRQSNHLSAKQDIRPGQQLLIWPGNTVTVTRHHGSKYYVIRKGDTLGSIAERFHMNLDQLRRLNGFKKEKLLQPGERIRIG